MSKEHRLNLIFFVILLLIIAPGYFILMKKKLTGPADPNYMPDPVQDKLAYVHPPGGNPNLPRVEPPEVRQWINKLIQDRFSHNDTVLLKQAAPVLSDQFQTQLIRLDQTDTRTTRAVLLIWKDQTALPEITFHSVDGSIRKADVDSDTVPLPKNILRSLQNVGYPFQLSNILLVIATDQTIAPSDLKRVTIKSVQSDKTSQETIHVN